ncbi:MAG: D-erythronate dehydrogenase [Geminicoccaceae bacterium]
MRVLITGGGGFIGKKLAARLLERGELMGRGIERVTLFDVMPAEGLPADPRLEIVTGDITRAGVIFDLVRPGYDAVYHLAAVVSGAAEADIDLGYAVNLDGTRHLLDAVRAFARKPHLVFASSCAVFGGALPEVIADDTPLTPQTSYGGQKAMGELLVADFHRKGFLDGRSLRLPTICIRPGKPNKAASTWASSIFREPLAGQEAVCPVTRETGMYLLSPRRVVDAFVQAIELPSELLGTTRHINLPGTTYSVAEMVAAIERAGGRTVVDRIRWEPDAVIQKIVDGWPRRFATPRAERLGFKADASLDEIVQQHVEDELGGKIAA